MWRVRSLEFEPVEHDFTGSDQGICTLTAVSSGGRPLLNMLEGLSFEPELEADPDPDPEFGAGPGMLARQICGGCGLQGCDYGGLVRPRRLGERVVWVPVGGSRCVPVFEPEVWAELRSRNESLPSAAELPPLDSADAAHVTQCSAPVGALGRYPSPPALRRKILSGVSDGDLEARAQELDRTLAEWIARRAEVKLLEPGASRSVAAFEFTVRGTPSWPVLHEGRGGKCLQLAPDVLLALA